MAKGKRCQVNYNVNSLHLSASKFKFKVYLQSTSKHIKVQQNAADRNCTWLPACAKASAQRGFNDCGSKAIHRRAASKAASHSLGEHSATFATSTNKQAQTGTNKTHQLPVRFILM